MTLAIAILAVAAGAFLEVDLPELRVSGPNPLTAVPVRNYRHADLNGDGATDLVLPTRVYLHYGKRFAPGTDIPQHPTGQAEHIDLFGDTLYLLSSTGLRLMRRDGDQWWVDHEEMDALPADYALPPAGLRQWSRYLQDIEGDGVPEILLAGDRGLYVYVRDVGDEGPAWKCVIAAPVYPPLRVVAGRGSALWPPTQRWLDLPTREMSCRIYIEGGRVTVRTREEQDDLRVRFRTETYRLLEGDGGPLSLTCVREAESLSPTVPAFVQPCLLAASPQGLGYAGGRWEWSPSQPLPMPTFETTVSTDGGSTFRKVRVRGFRPACSFVDFDGDGYADLVTEQTAMLDGGVRETVARFLTDAAVEHAVEIYRQDPQTRTFAASPTVSETFTIDLGGPPVQGTEMFHRYRSSELLLLNGDVNGDGIRDFVVQDRLDRVAVYYGSIGNRRASDLSLRGLLRLGRASRTPDAEIAMDPGWRFAVDDVDSDGRSDIVVRWTPTDEALAERSRVYLSRGDE